MHPNTEKSNPSISKFFQAEPPTTEGSGWISYDPEGKTKIKLLAVDEVNTSYDALLWLAADSTFGAGRHSHGGETYVYVLDGGYDLRSFTDHKDKIGTTTRYNKGDFVYQPLGQIHEEFLLGEDTLLYISNRNNNTIYEAFDEDGNVVATQLLAELQDMIKT